MTIRVFIADDHVVVRRAMCELLSDREGLVISGEASDARELHDDALAASDVLVLDLSLPPRGGKDVLRRVRAAFPTLVVIVHSMVASDPYRAHLVAAGAAAFVSKDSPPSELIAAIHSAAAARRADAPRVGAAPPPPPSSSSE